MRKKFRWLVMGVCVALLAAVATLGGCAAEKPAKPAELEQKIENARSRGDHEEIASQYEQQASVDKAAAEKHQGYARSYQRTWTNREGRQANMASHCENLAITYQQAADENVALAKLHRQLAAEAKD